MLLKHITYLRFSLSILCTVIIFIIDLLVPYEYLEWLLYIIPIFILYKIDSPVYIFVELALIAIFLVLGVIVETDSEIPMIINIAHRAEGFLTFAIFSFFVFRLNKLLQELKFSNIHLTTQSRELVNTVKELESFSYSVSHDLRSPLSTISGFSNLLKEEYSVNLDQTGKNYLDIIDTTAAKMNRLIDDLLRLSKVSKHDIKLEKISLSKLAESVIEELQKSKYRKNIKIIIKPDLVVTADSNLLRIVIFNLIGNAWKYTSKKSNPVIELGETYDNSKKVFYVRDNGVGFDSSKSNDLFEPFRRYHSEKDFPGTGIGLTIVRRIIERHGGRIWAKAESGKGATFFFTLGQ